MCKGQFRLRKPGLWHACASDHAHASEIMFMPVVPHAPVMMMHMPEIRQGALPACLQEGTMPSLPGVQLLAKGPGSEGA